jgi:Pregnancy-associated plasma protein-A
MGNLKSKTARKMTFWRWVFSGALPLLTSCALYSPSSLSVYNSNCSIPQDQSGTISGQWTVTPIPLAFHAGDFSTSEIQSVTQAADTWNAFFTVSKSKSTLSYGSQSSPTTSGNPDTALAANFCESRILQGNKFLGNVVIFKTTPWPYNATSAIALTSFCTIPANPYPKMVTALIEVNYQYFFATGKKSPDLQSVILHELGHLHGLGHSCENGTKAGAPKCTDASINPDYLAAVMFPSFTFDTNGTGEAKRLLQNNDQLRANCLY